jgi:hypothetical protein
VQDIENYLPDEVRAQLRAPVHLSAGARARVMQRVRDAAQSSRVVKHPRGMTTPTILGALLAASFVAAIIGGDSESQSGREHRTLADTIAAHFAAAAAPVDSAPNIDPKRLVAAADQTRQR